MSARIIDTSIWVGLMRANTARSRRLALVEIVAVKGAVICQPVLFEMEANATGRDWPVGWSIIHSTPMIATPPTLWSDAGKTGALLKRAGVQVPAIDLLIAQIALHHGATVVTPDRHFLDVQKVTGLQLELVG